MESTNNAPASTTGSPDLPLTLAQVEERLLQLVSNLDSNNYQIGKLYNHVVDKELALTGGFKDAQDFFKQRIKLISQSSLTMYGAVSLKFSEPTTRKYGMDKLYLLLSYARRAGLQVDGDAPGATPIDIPREDGEVAQKLFSECSRDEMRLATKHQRSPPPVMSELDMARIKRFQEHLDRGLPENHGIRVAARLENGALRLTLKNIPADSMERLVAALMGTPSRTAEAPPPYAVPHAAAQQTALPAQPQGLPAMPPPPHPGGNRNTGTGLRSLLRQAFQRPPLS